MTVRHATVASGTDSGTGEIHKAQWNDDHLILGSADNKPGSPDAADDEFEATLSGSWTAFGSPASCIANTSRPGHLYLRASGTGATLVGAVKSVSPAAGNDYRAKLVSSTIRTNYHRGGGIALFPSGAISGSTAPRYFGLVWEGSQRIQIVTYTSLSAFGSNTNNIDTSVLMAQPSIYFRVVFNADDSHIDTYYSYDGWAWYPHTTNFNCGFSVAQIGLACSEEGGGGIDTYWDWIRRYA